MCNTNKVYSVSVDTCDTNKNVILSSQLYNNKLKADPSIV